MADMFKQRESLQAPVMKALIASDPIMTNCNCELETLVASDSGVSLGLKNVASGKIKATTVPGFKVDQKVAGGVTTLTLHKVGQ